jgi:hypothetical protein
VIATKISGVAKIKREFVYKKLENCYDGVP